MNFREALKILDNGGRLYVQCPDGVRREVWGYNGATGDLRVDGWEGDVWMDCSDGTLKADFESTDEKTFRNFPPSYSTQERDSIY